MSPESIDLSAAGRRVVHVPMAFCVQGSTLITVARALSQCQAAAGEIPMAAVSDNRGLDLPEAETLYVDHTRYCPREYFRPAQLAVDVAAGALGMRRPYYGRLHKPTVDAVRTSGATAVLLYEGHYAAASLPWWGALRPATKVILYVHNPLSRTYSGRELRRLAKSCDAMVFCATHLRDAAASRLRGIDIPLEVVHNGIDPTFLTDAQEHRPRRDGPFELLFLGRTTPEKGVHVMLEALVRANKRLPTPARAVIVGSANYAAGELSAYELSLREMAGRAGVEVEFVPHVDRRMARLRMTSASAICIPSLWAEGLPLVALEAMASGTPVVTLDSPGVAEACGPAALYASGRDGASLGDALFNLVVDEPGRVARVALGLERARLFTWENTWAGLAQLIGRL